MEPFSSSLLSQVGDGILDSRLDQLVPEVRRDGDICGRGNSLLNKLGKNRAAPLLPGFAMVMVMTGHMV